MKQEDFTPDHISLFEKLIKEAIDQSRRPASEVILDDLDLRNLLKIARRTSLEYRQKGYLRFYKMDGKIFYILSEVLEDIKNTAKQQ